MNFIPLCCNGVGTAQASLPSARAGLTVGGRLCACLLLVVLARGNSPMPAGDQQSENYDPETDGRGNSTEGFGDMMSPHQNDTEAEVQMCQAKEMKDEAGVTMYHDNGDVMMAPDSSMCEQGTVPQVLVHDDYN